METLLANTSQWPILVVCYTNHALDQFLEGIQQFCKDNELIRIGGKSQCESLQKFNLTNIRSEMQKNRKVPTYIHNARSESKDLLNHIQEDISLFEQKIEGVKKELLGPELEHVIMKSNPQHIRQLQYFANGRSLAKGILNWLGYDVIVESDENAKNANAASANQDNNDENGEEVVFDEPEMDEEEINEIERNRLIDEGSDEEEPIRRVRHGSIHHAIHLDNIVPLEFGNVDDDGYQRVSEKKRKSVKNQFQYEIYKTDTLSQQEAGTLSNINSLLPHQRWNLYRLWIKLYKQELEGEIRIQRDLYRNECLRFNGLRRQEDIEIVQRAKIIGMTTTGAAKYRHIIDGTKPTITSW